MHHRILIAALLVPLLMLGSPAPASAQIDLGGEFQRAMIIANQITQISHQVSQIRSMARQLSELRGQLAGTPPRNPVTSVGACSSGG